MYHQEGEAGADAEVDVAAAEAAMGTTWTHKGVDRQGRPEAEAEAEVDAEVQAMMRTGVRVCAQQDTHKEVRCQGKAEVGAVVEAAEVVEAEVVEADVDAEVEVAGVEVAGVATESKKLRAKCKTRTNSLNGVYITMA